MNSKQTYLKLVISTFAFTNSLVRKTMIRVRMNSIFKDDKKSDMRV